MTDLIPQQATIEKSDTVTVGILRLALLTLLLVASLVISIIIIMRFQSYTPANPVFLESTLGRLAVWMADQSTEAAPESLLGQFARAQAKQRHVESLDADILLSQAQSALLVWGYLIVAVSLAGLAGWLRRAGWGRSALMVALLLTNALILQVPTVAGDDTIMLILLSSFLLIGTVAFSPGSMTRLVGFVVVLSFLLLIWEGSKAFAATQNYKITTPVDAWVYTTYATLEDGLAALENGDLDVVIADRKDVRDLMAPLPVDDDIDPATLPYPTLRYLTDIETSEAALGVWPIIPTFPGRLSIVMSAGASASNLSALFDRRIGAVAGSFAEARYLSADRNRVLLDMKIANDINLPHLQAIAGALLQPARRNGPLLLIRILTNAALHTWGEAVGGFVIGATLGLVLGSIFAHSVPMERGLLPYVVASQTVPILAIAPMVVIWLGAGPVSVAVISAYLTFFPVTINTLRGLRSPQPSAVELMGSYAATRWQTLWKLRFPAALPYIFTALKVSATASVVGAIIGELPSSIRNGLGRAILDFSSDYSLVSTPKLWGAIIIAASVGIWSFLIVSLIERLVVRQHVNS